MLLLQVVLITKFVFLYLCIQIITWAGLVFDIPLKNAPPQYISTPIINHLVHQYPPSHNKMSNVHLSS